MNVEIMMYVDEKTSVSWKILETNIGILVYSSVSYE